MKSVHTIKVKILPNRRLLHVYGKQEQFVQCNWFALAGIFLANGDEVELILPKFARPLYFSGFLVLPEILNFLEENSIFVF